VLGHPPPSSSRPLVVDRKDRQDSCLCPSVQRRHRKYHQLCHLVAVVVLLLLLLLRLWLLLFVWRGRRGRQGRDLPTNHRGPLKGWVGPAVGEPVVPRSLLLLRHREERWGPVAAARAIWDPVGAALFV